ncbi:hypothetical protein Rleg_5466 (plasmid) [Rhizobium leguminosarum bv. trifolii WSM1325]|uniref:Uncharacterized protein n=1 Tax=Rhizobium leguminosarum bv. trifolii (strain WSM1325) TaxID=395491 RepID=C6B8P8_RHILS|nr:hypothetical protein Rleg_5466 [Rhizobium leguminosarum bv. trifolii WSM1325]
MESLQFVTELELQHNNLAQILETNIEAEIGLMQEIWQKRRRMKPDALQKALCFTRYAISVRILRQPFMKIDHQRSETRVKVEGVSSKMSPRQERNHLRSDK